MTKKSISRKCLLSKEGFALWFSRLGIIQTNWPSLKEQQSDDNHIEYFFLIFPPKGSQGDCL